MSECTPSLEPCPFCGSSVELQAEDIFVCSGCGANVSLYAPDIISAWNHRERLRAPAPEGEAIEAAAYERAAQFVESRASISAFPSEIAAGIRSLSTQEIGWASPRNE